MLGGTGLYIDALLGRMAYPAVPPNQKLRAQLEKKSTEELFAMFKKLDPARAKTIDAYNPRRLVRAIEIAKALGKNPRPVPVGKYNVLWLGIAPTEKKLKQNIHLRTVARMKSGMIAEAKHLHKAGLSYKRMHDLGLEYRLLAQFLQKKLTAPELQKEIEKGNWDYAKRQYTWFKRNKNIKWIKSKAEALRLARSFLT